MNDTVLYDAADGIATITLNRPDKLNAMNAELLQGTLEAMERAAGASDVRAVILTGTGRAFCAGADLNEPNTLGDGDFQSRQRVLRTYVRAVQLLREMDKPTIAAVNGAAAGAGAALSFAADLRYAAESARFVTAYVNVGLSGDFGGTWTLPKIVGATKAREMYLLNEPVGAEEAQRIGLVSKVFADDALMENVHGIAARLVASAPTAVRFIKQNLNDADDVSFAEALDRDGERHLTAGSSADAREARAAFLEKREPRFDT